MSVADSRMDFLPMGEFYFIFYVGFNPFPTKLEMKTNDKEIVPI